MRLWRTHFFFTVDSGNIIVFISILHHSFFVSHPLSISTCLMRWSKLSFLRSLNPGHPMSFISHNSKFPLITRYRINKRRFSESSKFQTYSTSANIVSNLNIYDNLFNFPKSYKLSSIDDHCHENKWQS